MCPTKQARITALRSCKTVFWTSVVQDHGSRAALCMSRWFLALPPMWEVNCTAYKCNQGQCTIQQSRQCDLLAYLFQRPVWHFSDVVGVESSCFETGAETKAESAGNCLWAAVKKTPSRTDSMRSSMRPLCCSTCSLRGPG